MATGCFPYQPLRAGRVGACTHEKGSETPLSEYSDYSACFPHTTSPHRRARSGPHEGKATYPLMSWVSWHWGGYLGYIASAHGTGPPLVPPVGPPAWPTFSLAVGSKAFSLAPLGLGLSGLAPVSSPSLLLAAAGSGASHLWPLGSTALDRGSPGPIPAPSKVKRAKNPCWIFKFRGQPLWLIDK